MIRDWVKFKTQAGVPVGYQSHRRDSKYYCPVSFFVTNREKGIVFWRTMSLHSQRLARKSRRRGRVTKRRCLKIGVCRGREGLEACRFSHKTKTLDASIKLFSDSTNMPATIAGVITSAAAAICYKLCVKDTTVADSTVEEESPLTNLEGEDIAVSNNDNMTVSSVGDSTVLQDRFGKDDRCFLGKQCFLELATSSMDGIEVSVAGSS